MSNKQSLAIVRAGRAKERAIDSGMFNCASTFRPTASVSAVALFFSSSLLLPSPKGGGGEFTQVKERRATVGGGGPREEMESRDAYGRQSIRPPPPLLDESEEEGEEGSERSGVDPAEVPFVPVGHATDAMTDDRGQPPTSTSADGDAGAAPASAPAPSPQEQQQVMAGAHSAICERAYAYARFYLAQCADLARSEAMACGTRQGSQAESLAIAVAISRMQAFAEREDHAEESRRFASIYPADAQVYLSASALRSTVAEFVAAEQRMEILARFSERAPMPAAQAALRLFTISARM